jgi:Flp pilus assembly protein TadD
MLLRRRHLVFWAAWLVLPLLPRLGQLFFDNQNPTVVADRYLLLSLAPLSVFLASAGLHLLDRFVPAQRLERIATVVLVGTVAVFSGTTWQYGYSFGSDSAVAARAYEHYPRHPTVLNMMASEAISEEDFDAAIALLRQAIASEPKIAKLHLNLGVALSHIERHAEAAAAVEQGIALDPRVSGAYRLLGDTKRALNDLDGAAAAWLAELELNPNDTACHVNLGTYYYWRQDVVSARRHWEAALELSPSHSEALFNLAMLAANSGDEAAAAVHFCDFMRTAPFSMERELQAARQWLGPRSASCSPKHDGLR